LAQVVEQHYQEQFLAQFQAMFLDFELDATKVASRSSKNEKPVRQIFSDTELALLASFAEHSFRLPLSHFPPNFLAKIAQHFPPLYQQIELLIGHS